MQVLLCGRQTVPESKYGHVSTACMSSVWDSIARANVALRRGRLNTLLELKVENERLQQHLSVLRAHSQQLSATQSALQMGSYAGDDLSAQLAANLGGLPSRSTLGGDLPRAHYSMPHGYEAGAALPASSLEDDGDAEPRRKKVIGS